MIHISYIFLWWRKALYPLHSVVFCIHISLSALLGDAGHIASNSLLLNFLQNIANYTPWSSFLKHKFYWRLQVRWSLRIDDHNCANKMVQRVISSMFDYHMIANSIIKSYSLFDVRYFYSPPNFNQSNVGSPFSAWRLS